MSTVSTPLPPWQARSLAARAREVLSDLATYEERDSDDFAEALSELTHDLAEIEKPGPTISAGRIENAIAAAEKLMGWRCQGHRCTEVVERQWGYCSEGCYES